MPKRQFAYDDCEVVEKKRVKTSRCGNPNGTIYVYKDDKGEVHDIRVCGEHWNYDPPALDELCQLTVSRRPKVKEEEPS